MTRLCLAGTGPLGISAALTLRAQNALTRCVGWDPDPERLAVAKHHGALDTVIAFPQDALPEADVVLIDLSPEGLTRFDTLYTQHIKTDAIVARLGTDTRLSISALQRAEWTPCDTALHGHLCLIEGPPDAATEAFWRSLGCRVRWIPPTHGDTLFAAADQTPTLASAALVTALDELAEVFVDLEGTGSPALALALSGSKAPTHRILREIQNNRDALLTTLPRLVSVLQDIEGWVLLKQWDRLEALLERAHTRRSDFLDEEPSTVTHSTLEPVRAPLIGVLQLPGDKSISHRAVMLASVSHGTSRIDGFAPGLDVRSTISVFRALGARIEHDGQDTTVTVHGAGPEGLTAPASPLDCGNSGTTMRLLIGMLAGMDLPAVLTGDHSLSQRPMGRVADPLVALGCRVETDGGTPPVRVLSGGAFVGGRFDSPVASGQVKSAVLLAGLLSGRAVEVVEPSASRDHTETMLRDLGVAVTSSAHYQDPGLSGAARAALPEWQGRLEARDRRVPGDISSAAFILVAGAVVPGSRIELPGCGAAPSRTGVFHALARAGARIALSHRTEGGEPVADIVIEHGRIEGFEVTAEEVPTLVDEIPVLAVLAGQAHGDSVFRGLGELRVKESDRLALTARLLRACGCRASVDGDDLTVSGRGGVPFEAFDFDAEDDHRMAAAAVVASLVADGPCHIDGLDSLAVSYPGLIEDLGALQGETDI